MVLDAGLPAARFSNSAWLPRRLVFDFASGVRVYSTNGPHLRREVNRAEVGGLLGVGVGVASGVDWIVVGVVLVSWLVEGPSMLG